MSLGTNDLIADGAHLTRDAGDVLDALIGPGAKRPAVAGPEIEAELVAVLEAVEDGDGDCDSIAIRLDRETDQTMAALARLELLGYLERSFAGGYARTTLPAPASLKPSTNGCPQP
jgi:predicted Rossmann fold nucleotide-binding protein DprA/Smf involved in DNA uptake